MTDLLDATFQRTRDYSLGTILVADGGTGWGTSLAKVLESAGFDPYTAGVGADLTVAFQELRPDLVVLSAEAASPSVLTLCAWIKSRTDVPVVVAAETNKWDSVLALEAGADATLRLPVGEGELVARMRALLRRRPPRSRRTESFTLYGGLELDREHRVLRTEHADVALDANEFALMEALMAAGSGITSRRSLRTALCLTDTEVDSLVRRLRENLEAVEGWRRIVTQRSVGFRLLEAPS